MAGLTFSGRASKALNAGIVDYTQAMAAADQMNENLDMYDRRKQLAGLKRPVVALPQVAALSGALPPQLTMGGDFDVGTKHSPTVGVVPPGGATIQPPKTIVTDPVTDQAATSFIQPDGTVLTPSISEWNAMSGQQQAAHIVAVNNARGAVAGSTLPPRSGRAAGLGLRPTPAKPISLKEYAATLPKDPVARRGKPAVTGAPAVNTANFTKNTQALLAQLPAAAQSPKGQRISEFARAVGVNPAVSISHWGMESSFGASKKIKTWAEAQKNNSAYGEFQVLPSTLLGRPGTKERGTLAHFSDPKVLAKYGNEANNINALMQMFRADPDSEDGQIAAGTLQALYLKDIGVPENLMGAAYQSDPHAVLKAGAPVAATDGNMSNSDYSSNWNALFAAQDPAALGGGGSTASSPAPQQAAAPAGIEVPKTGNKSFDSRVKFAVAKPASEYDFQTQQLTSAYDRHVKLLQREEQMLAQEQQRISQSVAYAEQKFSMFQANGDAVGMAAAMDELDATQKLNEDAQRRGLEFAKTAQPSIDGYHKEMIANEGDRAIRDLAFGDPTRASKIVSAASGRQVIYQASTGGGFVKIGNDGQYVLEYPDGPAKIFSAIDITREVYDVTNDAAAAAMAAGDATRQSRQEESDLKIKEKMVDILGQMKVAEINKDGDFRQKVMELDRTIKDVKDDGAGGFNIFYYNRIVTLTPGAMQTMANGEQVPKEEITVRYIGGLNTNG